MTELITQNISLELMLDLPIKKDLVLESRPQAECYIDATNDLEAARVWLTKYQSSPKTYTVYQREVLRFLMWCQFEAGKTLTELSAQDYERYFKFVQNPPDHWCASRSQLTLGKKSKYWKPFTEGVGKTTFNKIITVLNSFIAFLTKARYLAFNALELTQKTRGFSPSADEVKYQIWSKMLEEDEWQAVQLAVENLPEKTKRQQDKKIKIQFLFYMLYFLGLRIEELATARWNNFRFHNNNWWFFVKGKGGKLAHIPVHDKLLSFMKIYRLHLGLVPLPPIKDDKCLFLSSTTKEPLKIRQLYSYVKEIGRLAAMSFDKNPGKQAKLQALSPHWLRHLSASHQASAGISSLVIQNNLRHQSHHTTQIYLHSEDELRHDEIQKLDIGISPKITPPKSQHAAKILTIEISKGPLDRVKVLGDLIDIIEDEVLVGCEWQRYQFDKDTIIDKLSRSYDKNKPILIKYKLVDIKQGKLNLIKKALQREAEIRMFDLNLIKGAC